MQKVVEKKKSIFEDEPKKERIFNPEDENSKKYKCKFVRFDQPTNVLKTSRRKAIGNAVYDWEGELMSGKVYELPKFVIDFLNSRMEPIYGQTPKPGGINNEMITEKVGEKPRFSCQIIL